MLRRAQLSSVCRSAFLLLYLWQCTVRKNLQTSESGNRTSGGNSFCRIWIFGLVVVVPIIRDFGRALKDAGLIKNAGDGNSILTTSLILAMMILPTIIGTTESAMRAVPAHYYEGALALGATKERSIFRVIIPAAKSGVIAGIVLGIGRAVGETMAVIMVAGNQPRLVGNLFKGIRTLTGNIVMEMGYATGLHREALIATGVVLLYLS